ncbi:uncharacterized protein LOC101742860 [Bombyx mori]|uniref:Uncharacterized protein n=1 Tax=Bombyx mori TaxID=7091 RepID=A0A8R1WLP6_BOMMO|nr:uncharacterized protein LOC101742860 [Bombyx mori]
MEFEKNDTELTKKAPNKNLANDDEGRVGEMVTADLNEAATESLGGVAEPAIRNEIIPLANVISKTGSQIETTHANFRNEVKPQSSKQRSRGRFLDFVRHARPSFPRKSKSIAKILLKNLLLAKGFTSKTAVDVKRRVEKKSIQRNPRRSIGNGTKKPCPRCGHSCCFKDSSMR